MIQENVDRRILGAIRFIDGITRQPARSPLKVWTEEGVRLFRNLSGDFIVLDAIGLHAHTEIFDQPPADPAPGSLPFVLLVADLEGEYLARRFTIRLPRDPDPRRAGGIDSLFRPLEVALYPSPASRTALGWAVVRCTVRQARTGKRLSGALIRVLRAADRAHLASGLSDKRGEALVAVPGIPVTTWGEGAGEVLATEVEALLEVVVDPTAPDLPDPDDLEARRATLPTGESPIRLASGREERASLEIAIS